MTITFTMIIYITETNKDIRLFSLLSIYKLFSLQLQEFQNRQKQLLIFVYASINVQWRLVGASVFQVR